MRIGLLLLTQSGAYIDEDGNLPDRPLWDKQFLMDITEGMRCKASYNTYNSLPERLKRTCDVIPGFRRNDKTKKYDIHLGIDGLEEVDLLIITRSHYIGEGKVFRLDKFRMILKIEELEIWKRM
jgi:hypothetical protein